MTKSDDRKEQDDRPQRQTPLRRSFSTLTGEEYGGLPDTYDVLYRDVDEGWQVASNLRFPYTDRSGRIRRIASSSGPATSASMKTAAHRYKDLSSRADQYALRLPFGLKPRLEKAAAENERSLNSEIVYRLYKSLEGWKR